MTTSMFEFLHKPLRRPAMVAMAGAMFYLGLAASAVAAPIEIEASVTHLDGYETGGCFLHTIPKEPLGESEILRCSEYSWVLTNTTKAPIHSIEASDDFSVVLDKYSTGEQAAQLVDIRVTEALGMRAKSFHENVFVAIADTIPPEGTVALRLRVEIRHPSRD